MSKSYNIKVYGKNGLDEDYIKTLNYSPRQPGDGSKDEVLLSVPRFNAKKNGGLGQCTLEFNVKFDDFGSLAAVIVPMNEFRIYEVNTDYPEGRKIYSGFLDSYEPQIKQGKEITTVKLLGYASVLTMDDFRTSGGSTTVNYTATDPGQMARDIFTRVGELYPQVNFDTSSIPLLGWTTNYKFENLTWKDAIDLVQKIAGTSFYWYVDQDNKAYFLEKASSAQKRYQVGDDVQEIKATVKTDEVKNRVVFKWASGTITKTDSASITAYGQRTNRVSAESITDSTAADIQAQYILDQNKNPKTNVVMDLNTQANFYDVQPGQTVKILGLKEDQNLVGNNLQIESIRYSADILTIELEESRTLADEVKAVAEAAQKF